MESKFEKKIAILATQVDLLNTYNPVNKRKRMNKSWYILRPEFGKEEPSHTEIDNAIQRYDFELSQLTPDTYKDTERIFEVKAKRKELYDRLISSPCQSL